MCHLQNIAMRNYQESVTTGKTDEMAEVWRVSLIFNKS